MEYLERSSTITNMNNDKLMKQKLIFKRFLDENAPKYEKLISSVIKNTILYLDLYLHSAFKGSLAQIYEDCYQSSVPSLLRDRIAYISEILLDEKDTPSWLPIEDIINSCEIDLFENRISDCNNVILYDSSCLEKIIFICAPALKNISNLSNTLALFNILLASSPSNNFVVIEIPD